MAVPLGIAPPVQATAFIAAACRVSIDPLASLFATALSATQRAMVASGTGEVLSRTRIIDSMLLEWCPGRTVLNLGAGLCTRPYRLDLSTCVSLTEVDAAPVLELKTNILSGYSVSCPVHRIAGDARSLPSTLTADVVLTEGLLVYLSPSELAALASCLPGSHWIADIVPASSAAFMAAQTGISLWGLDSLTVFEDAGWTVVDYRPLPVPRAPSPSSHAIVDGVLHLTR
ncbi:class I SAM-dependent methyltransferase [Catelliglobosispora koreensis]|uniref:class I SAM-dependent methyltransferase n=1 Tax=Catelliglobosispora koreensis TaxID=129052 RepID=UPI0003A24FF3|nr:class I SAM-dependent methyltransferase [Catelliglobosispora koreensis]